MATRNKIGGVNRVVALVLALVWLGTGIIGIVLGVVHGQWLLVAVAIFAIWYAVVWFRIVARSRLLKWRELIAQWRAE
jgi:hypothetical protein